MSAIHENHQVPEQEMRMSAARAKAEAARAAVERRRSSSTNLADRGHSAGEADRAISLGSGRAGSESAGEIIIKHRPTSGPGSRSHTPVGGAGSRSHTPVGGAGSHSHIPITGGVAGAGADAAVDNRSGTPVAAQAQPADSRSATPLAGGVAGSGAGAPMDSRSATRDTPAAASAGSAGSRSVSAGSHSAGARHTAEGPQTAADYAAALEELLQKRAQLAKADKDLDERLQLYSEVVGLRKELAVVREDEERLRQQLATTEAVVAASDPEVAKEVAIFEDEAQQSHLQKVWLEESEYHNPDNMEWSDIDVHDLRRRVDAARAKFKAADEKADNLYALQEEAINETTDAREREKANIAENHEREMESLGDARAHARQVATERHFHRHRGTANRAERVLSTEKERAMRQRGVDEVEFRTTAQVSKMKDELAELMEQVKTLKNQLDNSRATTEAKRREQEAALKVVEDEGAEARDFKAKLLKEEEELNDLKADLQGVLHYVRAKNREEEGW